MSFKLDGSNPLAYAGVRATTPAQMLVMQRPPTTQDYIGYQLGTQWVYYIKDTPSVSVQYFLSSVAIARAIRKTGFKPKLFQEQ